MKNPTTKQTRILDFIITWKKNYDIMPTYQEIAKSYQVSITSIKQHIIALEKKGYIKRGNHKARSLKILKEYK